MSLFLSKIFDNLRRKLEIFSCFHWSSMPICIVAHQCDGVLVPIHLVPWRDAGDVDCREVVQTSTKFFCPSRGQLRISILLVLLPPDYDGVLPVLLCSLFWRPSRSNGLFAIESHRVSFLLNDSLVQESTALSKLGTRL